MAARNKESGSEAGKPAEKQLLDIIKNNTGGELSKLSTNLVMQEVMPYIASCIEHITLAA